MTIDRNYNLQAGDLLELDEMATLGRVGVTIQINNQWTFFAKDATVMYIEDGPLLDDVLKTHKVLYGDSVGLMFAGSLEKHFSLVE